MTPLAAAVTFRAVQAPIAVAVEIRALDVGPRVVRAFRLSLAIDEDELRLERDLPFEAGRPVSIELTLPDGDPRPLRADGRVVAVALSQDGGEAGDGEPRPRGVSFAALDPEARRRIARYVEERMSPWQSV